MSRDIRRNMALFPMSIVMQLTELSARQIRYYEKQELIHPSRNKGKQRIFSLNDIDRLLEIKDYLEQGINVAGIKTIFELREQELREQREQEQREVLEKSERKQDLSERELHKWLKSELISARAAGRAALTQGELSRFFH
ncbi:MerR family transcriptional regulator [Caldalkalibacillus salinus]|uniref:MerR family transcriptional regulator n=1 Tax=Caldalkalibacillus salinus TaxID=2803787 RepID=UPI0019248EB0|nr:MerR family transcriptional regulator [Caldalkalibacillus salinus]